MRADPAKQIGEEPCRCGLATGTLSTRQPCGDDGEEAQGALQGKQTFATAAKKKAS